VAVARRTAPTRAVAADASFEEDEYLDELLGETGGGAKKKKAHEPVKSAEITMDADDVGDPEARERERDLARAKAAGEAAVARMKAKLAKQGFKAKDQGPVPDVVARPKKKVMVARVDEDEDEDEDEDAADQDEDEDDASADEDEDEDEDADEAPRAKKADRKVEKKVEKVEKVEKKAEKKAEKVEPESEPEPDKVASPRKKKAKGEFYASGEGFLAEDDGGGEPEAADDDDAADDEAADEDEPASAPRKSKKATKAKKSKKKSNRAARSSKRKSRGATKADRRSRKKSSDDDA
jgi:hypothetical protein